MPCRSDGWDTPEKEQRNGLDIGQFEATLCGIFTLFEKEGEIDWWLDRVNWKEAGVKRGHVEAWWTRHKKADEDRRKREEAARRKEELKAHALSKLTEAERIALGLK